MILSDMHMHCSFSNDSDTDPRLMIKSAIDKGLKTICFTDHYDKDNYDWGDEAIFNEEEYFHTMPLLRDEYRDLIDIRTGAEIGLMPHLAEEYRAFEAAYEMDFIIGSAHSIKGHDLARELIFIDHTDQEAYRVYYEELLEDVRKIKSYDVFGHFDFIVRYSKEGVKSHKYTDYMDLIDEILRVMISDGKGIEINTSGFRYGVGFPHPHISVLKRFRQLGGEIVTVGADAHVPEHVAYGFDAAQEILREAGFRYYAIYSNRKPKFVKL